MVSDMSIITFSICECREN